MDDTFNSDNHRYHVESCVGKHPLADTYRVFTRRKVGQKIKRRYYALMVCHSTFKDQKNTAFDTLLENSLQEIPYPVYIFEEFDQKEDHCVVLARGKQPSHKNTVFQAIKNKGYLMILLAIVIFIIMLLQFLAAPSPLQ